MASFFDDLTLLSDFSFEYADIVYKHIHTTSQTSDSRGIGGQKQVVEY